MILNHKMRVCIVASAHLCTSMVKLIICFPTQDVVLAKMRDEDDHVDWLLAHDKYEEALETVQRHVKELKRHNFQDISREYIKYLIEEGLYKEAALQCSKSLKTRPQWEEQVYTFARIGQLKIIAPYLPKGRRGIEGLGYDLGSVVNIRW